MIKQIQRAITLLSTVIFCFYVVPLACAADKADMQQILKKLDELSRTNQELVRQNRELNKRITVLEQQKDIGAGAPSQPIEQVTERVKRLEEKNLDGEVKEIKEDVADLSSILTSVERRSLMDKVQIGVELRTRADWFDYRAKAQQITLKSLLTGKKEYKHLHDNVQAKFSNRLRLNLRTDITDNVRFTGRVTMYKNWIDNDYEPLADWYPSRYRTDNTLRVERAYVDYFFTPWEKLPMAFTFGRLPTTDGMPNELRDDTPRKSTYPTLCFDLESDGMAMSFMLDNLTGLRESALRVVYCRMVSDDDSTIYRSDSNGLKDLTAFLFQFEAYLPSAYLKDIFLVSNVLYFPDHPALDISSMGLKPVDIPDDWGDLWKFTTLLEAKNYLGSRFDWFLGYSFSYINGSGDPAIWRLGPIRVPFALESDTGRNRSGYAFQAGVRYTLAIAPLKNPKIGLEYNYASKDFHPVAFGTEDPLNKASNRGYCWDFYYIQPVNDILIVRLGYTFMRKHYTDLPYKQPTRLRETITNPYVLIDAKF